MFDNLTVTLILDYFGMIAPAVLLVTSIFLLQNKIKYLQIYLVGFILNLALNAILKYAIKEPRPTQNEKILKIAVANNNRISFDKYGMPSGHAQTCGYSLAFITLVLNKPLITGLYLVATLISVSQRYRYLNHSILQLIVGLAIGIGFGYLAYYIGNKWIKGNLKMKPDDYAFK